MLRNTDDEKEILLGNKQLFGVFVAVVVLLGVAFAGGYMIGRGTGVRSLTTAPATLPATGAQQTPAASTTPPAIGETHSIPADTTESTRSTASTDSGSKAAEPHDKASLPAPAPPALPAGAGLEEFNPSPGERFLQVAAVSREEADEVAEVLHKKGFRAHAAPKPGNPRIYRVLIGPIRDAADLSATRDALRRTGFSEVITQRY
jgi:cell division septation protein DedD